MATVALSNLISKIRRITARPSSNQISDAEIVNYINLFYQFDFPNNLKTFDFKTNYSFITQPNQDKYILSQANRNLYKSFEPPVYCAGYEIGYYQSRQSFYNWWPNLTTSMTLATATGIAGPYTGTLSAVPVLRGEVVLSVVGPLGNTLTAQDNSLGGFTGDVVAGTINYITGAISITWNAVIPAGNLITARWVQYQASRPLAILFYDDAFILRPVPDQAYKIEIQAFITPFAVAPQILPLPEVHEDYSMAVTDALPYLNEYFQLIAYGAALKILADSLEMENYQMVKTFYLEQLMLIERRTIMQIKTQRTPTIYSENLYWTGYRMPNY